MTHRRDRARRGGTRQLSDQAEKDLKRADLLTAPFTFVALVVVFGSLVAAGLPLVVALFAVVGTFAALKLLAKLTDVSVFSLNLATGLGLGLAIDYSLFVVSRYREELATRRVAAGRDRPVDADRRPHGRVQRGHRRDLAHGARDLPDSVPALVRVRRRRRRGARRRSRRSWSCPRCSPCSGPKVEKFRLFKVREVDARAAFWRRQADRVMRHPVPYAVDDQPRCWSLLAIPFFHVNPGLSDDRVGPKT